MLGSSQALHHQRRVMLESVLKGNMQTCLGAARLCNIDEGVVLLAVSNENV